MTKESLRSTTLYCFSPAVMALTCVIESCLALYTLARYRGKVGQLAVYTLLCLASFQFAEYQVCDVSNAYHMVWTRFGLVGISFLPALGVHIASVLTKRSPLVWIGYAVATFFALCWIFVPSAANTAYCLGNYTLFTIANPYLSTGYQWYYFGFILVGMTQSIVGWFIAGKVSKKIKQARIWLLVGYLSFTVPMAVVAYLYSQDKGGTVSIMCGFALIFAILLAMQVVPLAEAKKA